VKDHLHCIWKKKKKLSINNIVRNRQMNRSICSYETWSKMMTNLWSYPYDPSCVFYNCFPTPHNGWIPMEKTKIFKFFNKGLCSPLVYAFWRIFMTKNNVEWKSCSHVKASLLKFNVIAQVSIHKGLYNVRITTTVKIVNLSPSDHGATCMIHFFIHTRSAIWKKNVAIIKKIPKNKIKHNIPKFINLIQSFFFNFAK
jgi:hypothetical protein